MIFWSYPTYDNSAQFYTQIAPKAFPLPFPSTFRRVFAPACSFPVRFEPCSGTCYIKLVSNCTAPSTTSLSVEAEYTANLVQNYMSGSVFEESETGTQGALRAYFGGGRKAPGGMRFQGTTGSVNTYLPSNTAFLKLASGTKLNLCVTI